MFDFFKLNRSRPKMEKTEEKEVDFNHLNLMELLEKVKLGHSTRYLTAGKDVITLNGYYYESVYECFDNAMSLSLNGEILYKEEKQTGRFKTAEEAVRYVKSIIKEPKVIITKNKPEALIEIENRKRLEKNKIAKEETIKMAEANEKGKIQEHPNNIDPRYQLQTAKVAEMRQPLVDSLIKSLEAGEIPWEKCWKSEMKKPFNYATNVAYKGINNANLMLTSMMRGYTDPRFMTFNQVKEKGWRVKQGSKAIRVEYWAYHSSQDKKTISIAEWNKLSEIEKREKAKNFKLKVFPSYVFNAACINGIPPLEKELKEQKRINRLDLVVKSISNNIGLLGITEGYDKACYIPKLDKICMPSYANFKDGNYYYSTMLHELAHATGHEKRMNRKILNSFGSPEYAREELRAELSSMFLSQELNMNLDDKHMNNHKGYIQSWLKMLKEEPNELFKAIKDAQGISDYMVKNASLDKVKEFEMTTEKTMSQELQYQQPKLLHRFGK